MVDALVLIETIDAVPLVEYCNCGRPRSEHTYWVDRIYDYNGYRCPNSLGDDYRFDAVLTARRHKEARAFELEAALARVAAQIALQWQPIETAPKGSWPDGPEFVTDPAYVAPPHLWLTLKDGQRCVGYFDAYYAEGGNGYDGDPPWVEEFSGERVQPTHWARLPPPLSGQASLGGPVIP